MRKTLVTTVTNILCKRVTELEAMQFALNNYGVLCAHIRAEYIATVKEVVPAPVGKEIQLKKRNHLRKLA